MKKILYSSNFSKASTGFGRHARTVLTHLYSTGKYEIVEYAAAPYTFNHPRCKTVPWKCYGALADSPEAYGILNNDPKFMRQIAYGAWNLDKVVKEEKPDIFIACEDIWAFDGAERDGIKMPPLWEREWWNKIPCVIWTPVDSLPIFPLLTENADKIKNLWVKAPFAENELHRLGYGHVKTVPALIDDKPFKPLDRKVISGIRNSLGITDDMPIFGFVFRNQLRKLVITLLEGFKKYKDQNPESKAKLHLHTHFNNGQWDIPRAIKELGLNNNDILCTYICRHCKKIILSPFRGQKQNCAACRTKESISNPDHDFGVTEEELNIIYNIYAFNGGYIHPVTSGGFEMPILEAIYAGAPAATVPYAFGTNFVDNGIADTIESKTNVWEEGSLFIKAQPSADSVYELMSKYANMTLEERTQLSTERRNKALELFQAEKHLIELEKFIDEQPETDYNFNFTGFIPEPVNIAKWFLPTKRKRLLYTMPGSNGDCLVSLSVLESLKRIYPIKEWDFYVATSPQFMEIFKHLDWVTTIPFHPLMENYKLMEGCGDEPGLVNICFMPHLLTQRLHSYHHNGEDICELQKYE